MFDDVDVGVEGCVSTAWRSPRPLASKTRTFIGTGDGRLGRVIVLMKVFFEAQVACKFIDVCLHFCSVDTLRGGDKGKVQPEDAL